MSIFKCKMCGGTLEIQNNETIATCEYCGTQQTLPKSREEVIANLFNRANNLRLKCEFDKAADIYEKIVEQDDSEAEAHWGIVLCKYGIEYVEDPKTFSRIPTCHRTLFQAVTADPDYQASIAYGDSAQQQIYEREARAIDRIQKDILAIVKNEAPFDVFICYKETDESGKRTVDSTIANDIYYQLTQEGFKVFYAAITLEDKLGEAYEPYIFAALNSAKVMLVLGTKPEYFTAVWVRNEWSRFLNLMKTDRSKLLIPCYRDMDAYDLPEEFAHLQAQDMGKIGFINDVVRGIKKVVGESAPAPAVVKETVVTATGSVAPLLKRAFMFLEDGDWAGANEYCEKVLDMDPENAQAYLGKLMAELQVKTQDDLKYCAELFTDFNNYQKAMRFADEDLKLFLMGAIDFICERKQEESYVEALSVMEQANTETAYRKAARCFEELGEYKDAKQRAQECLDQAEVCRKDEIYNSAMLIMIDAKEIGDYYVVKEKLTSIRDWKDAGSKIAECDSKMEELNKLAEERELKRQADWLLFKKRLKKVLLIGTPIVALIIALILLLNYVIIPTSKYNDAVALMNAGEYMEAIDAFKALNGYKDSAAKITACEYNNAVALMNAGKYTEAIDAFKALNGYQDSAAKITACEYNNAVALMNAGKYSEAITAFEKINGYSDSAQRIEKCKIEIIKNPEKGDVIKFGTYEQDNNTANGQEEIEWIVLDKKDGKALIISKYGLDVQQYNTTETSVTWETCTLRNWLNTTFYTTAFNTDQQSKIVSTTLINANNPSYGTEGGNNTTDKVFLLSIDEAKQYFASKTASKLTATAYAKAQGAYDSSDWWIRSPGEYRFRAAVICYDGSVRNYGYGVNYAHNAVRPALWINLES